MYKYRNEVGQEFNYKCYLDDKIITLDFNGVFRIGKVVALDDDGWLTINTGNEECRVHNDWIKGVITYPITPKVLGRCWLKEVKFVPNTNWDNDTHYDNVDGHDDWLVGEFSEGKLWMNNNKGYVVLVQPNGICLFDYI